MSLSPLGLLSARDASQQRSRHRSFFGSEQVGDGPRAASLRAFRTRSTGFWTRDLRSLLANVHDRPFTNAEVPALLAYLGKL